MTVHSFCNLLKTASNCSRLFATVSSSYTVKRAKIFSGIERVGMTSLCDIGSGKVVGEMASSRSSYPGSMYMSPTALSGYTQALGFGICPGEQRSRDFNPTQGRHVPTRKKHMPR